VFSSYAFPHHKDPINLRTDDTQQMMFDVNSGQVPLQAKALDKVSTEAYTVLKVYDRKAPYYYTQGLTFASENILLESAGLYGESGMHYLNLADMTTNSHYQLEGKYFGEGADYILNEAGEKEIYQLTWRERDVMVFDPENMTRKRMMQLPSQIKEGWGITKSLVQENGKLVQNVYVTDGSANVFVCDPATLAVKKTLLITDDDGNKVRNLNELELVQGKLWANVYLTNNIAVINLDSGKVEKFLDFTSLVDTAKDSFWQPWEREYCLNGIAYNPDSNRLVLTGKKWTQLFEIRMNE